MKSSSQNIISAMLIILSITAAGFAIYYYLEKEKLEERIVLIENKESEAQESDIQNDIARIDSLIFDKDYTGALELSRELRGTSTAAYQGELEVRYQLATAVNRAMDEAVVNTNDTILLSDGSTSSNLIVDSLNQELNRATNQISALQSRLNNTPATEYLDFETSRGTKLHYVGATKNHKANGYGIAILDSGSRYEGYWKDNMRHGEGKFYWDDGEIYEGSYLNDMRDGMGTYYWDNGDKYVGEWKEDGRNGYGKFYNRRGKLKSSGIWKDDKLEEED